MKPTINTPAGQYAVDLYLQEKKVAHPEAADWGTPQMIPRIAQRQRGRPANTGTAPRKTQREPGASRRPSASGSMASCRAPKFTGKMRPPLDLVAARGDAGQQVLPRKAQAAYLALWLGSGKNSIPIVSDQVNTFHDAWA